MELLETSLVAPHPESKLFLFRAYNSSFGRHQQTAIIVQQRRERVFQSSGVVHSLTANESRNALGQAEQMNGLVE